MSELVWLFLTISLCSVLGYMLARALAFFIVGR
jgi:hypothetical protein